LRNPSRERGIIVKISVFLADWQVLFREGIHFTLSGEEDMEVVGEATTSEDALKEIEANPPGVAVLNTNHDELGGIQATRYLRQNYPSTSVLLIMDSDNEEQLFQAMKAGASACLTKEAEPSDLIDSIRAAAQGHQPICDALLRPAIASRVLDEFEEFTLLSEQVDNLLPRLTPGETEILHQLANETSVEEICQAMNIAEETISQHFRFVVTKLVTNDHIRQVIEAAQNGLLSMILRARLAGQPPAEYITRDEFAAFKDSIKERFRSVVADIS